MQKAHRPHIQYTYQICWGTKQIKASLTKSFSTNILLKYDSLSNVALYTNIGVWLLQFWKFAWKVTICLSPKTILFHPVFRCPQFISRWRHHQDIILSKIQSFNIQSVSIFYVIYQNTWPSAKKVYVLYITTNLISLSYIPIPNTRHGCQIYYRHHHDHYSRFSWWRHQMEKLSALLAICAGNSPVPGEFPTQRPVTRSFDVFFDLCLNKRLSKQS